jgi:hypothetical protein
MRAAMPFLDPADSPEVEADWREAVTAAFNDGSLYWIPSAVVDKYFLEGKCPRCKHSMDQVHRIGTYLTELNVRAGGASRRETHETIRTAIVCNCEPDEGPHKDKTLGCGYAPSIEVDVPNPTQEWRLSTPLPAVGPAAKSDRDYWDGLALKAEREQLKAVQDSATKWTAITGTLLGLFGTVAFATGLSAIEDPADAWLPTVVRAATTVAFLLILYGTWSLAKAAGGLNLKYYADGFDGVRLEQETTKRVVTAKRELDNGRKAALYGTLIVLIGTAVIFWCNKTPPSVSKVAGVTTNGQIVCGELQSNGSTTTIGASTTPVTNIVTVTKCPGS